MQNNLTRKLVLTALFAALICVVTMLVKFPVPGVTNAYVNAGDGVIYAAGVALAGPWAALAAGLGSAFADLLVGAAVYAPATLIIKALMGLVVGAAFYGRDAKWSRYLLFMILAALIMTVGYGVYELFIYGFAVMLTNLPFNLIQAGGGVIIGLLLALLVRRVLPQGWLDTFRRPHE